MSLKTLHICLCLGALLLIFSIATVVGRPIVYTPDFIWVSTLPEETIVGSIAQRDPSRLGSQGEIWLGEWGGKWVPIPEEDWIEYRGFLACVPEHVSFE